MANLQGDSDICPPLATAMLEKDSGERPGTVVYFRCVDKSWALSCQAGSFAFKSCAFVINTCTFLSFGNFYWKVSKIRNVRYYPSSEMVSLSGEHGQGVSR